MTNAILLPMGVLSSPTQRVVPTPLKSHITTMKLTYVFTTLITFALFHVAQAKYCYCQNEREDPILGETKDCCQEVMGTRTLHSRLFGKDIYCDVGGTRSKSGYFNACCERKSFLTVATYCT
ncbi:hypothetical protein BDZ89DRAFT_199125 [Hymenopellis radicata]|nr:hypothetical protein BDZ89DRAFT_199125 [Hymenopellis radicata]